MKFKFVLFFIFVFITFNIVNNAYSQNKDRGLWVWSATDGIIDDFVANDQSDTTWESFISFCEAPHGDSSDRITNLYMSAYSYMLFNENRIRLFLADMNSRGYKVFVVLADPTFASPNYSYDDNEGVTHYFRTDFEDKIDDIMEYQQKVEPAERFAGIMLDIEPHLIPELPWKNRRDRPIPKNFIPTWDTYINDLTYCKAKIDEYNTSNSPLMTFSDAAASWYDDGGVDWNGDGTDDILTDDIMPLVSFYTVQAYSDTTSVIVSISAGEVLKASQLSKECVIGVETIPLSSPEVTFWEEGHNVLEAALGSIYDPDNSSSIYRNNDAFGGFFIHSYANNDDSELGYQNLTPTVNDHAPLITITYPNGIEADGISFSDDFQVNWKVYNPDSIAYDVKMYYKFETDLDNEAVEWTLFDNETNLPYTVTSSTSTFDITGIETSPGDRIIIKAKISYHTDPSLNSYDTTNFGIGIKEIPVMNQWSDDMYLDYDGYPQGMRVITDSDNVLHAAYYVYFDRAVDLPGVYYAHSLNAGVSWTFHFLTPGSYYYDGGYIQSSWPRRPSLSKYGDVIAVAWVEDITQDNDGFYDKVIALQINDNDGNADDWLSSKIVVESLSAGTLTNVEVHVDSITDVHLVWEAYYDSSNETRIEYAKYSYNQSGDEWQTSGVEIVTQDDTGDYFFRSPAVTSSSYGVHAVWGEYKKSTTGAGAGSDVFEEVFNNYSVTTPVNWSHSISEFNWEVYGAGSGGSAIMADPDNTSNKVLKIQENISGTSNGFGVAQRDDFSPAIDLTSGNISFKIKTNLTASVPGKITAQIITDAIEAPGFYLTFSLPSAEYYDIPASASGNWTTLTFPIEDLTYSEAAWAHPNLENIKKVQIRFHSGTYNSLSSAQIYIDEFKAQGTQTVVYDPEMRIVSKTKSASWETEKEIFTQTYSTEQDYPRQVTAVSNLNYPLYFPKITSYGDYVFTTWQFTTLGTPDNDSLDQYSSIYFSKCDVSSSSNNWDTPSQLSATGYAPYISVCSNDGTPTVQIVFSDDFDELVPDESHTGDLIYLETTNGGSSWSTPVYFAQGSGLRTGIRRPYINNSYSGNRAFHFMSYPFIFTDENGLSTVNWINGGKDGSGLNTGAPEEFCKIRGTLFLNSCEPPFADLSDNEGFFVKWTPPETSYAPTAYSLRRVPNNDESQAYNLNSGNPIHALHFYDNSNILPNVHYRYELLYHVNGVSSPWSALSNVVRDEDYLLLDDFELLNGTETYTGNEYELFDAHKPISAQIVSDQSASGSYSLEVTYTDDDPEDPKGAVASIVFPSVMDFSSYGGISLQIRFKPGTGMVEREVLVTLQEETSLEQFTIGDPIMLVNDGQWHEYNFFLDEVTPEIPGTTIDLNDIRKLSFVTWGNGSTSYYVDDIKLNGRLGGTPILSINPSWITAVSTTGNPGVVFGNVINADLDPVVVEYGNAPDPWSIRIYTLPQVYDDSEQEYIVKKNGLIRYDFDNDTYYPRYNLPIKVWCKNFGPEGFFYPNGVIINPTYAQKGYPSIDNEYFLKGYDFDNDGQIYGLLVPADNESFIEGLNAGEYSFDLDGDGFQQDDDYFDPVDNRATISEEPVWRFVPVLKHDTVEMDNEAIVMDPADEDTWLVLTDSYLGSGEHFLELYFATFVGEEQILYKDYDNAYGNYTVVVVVEILYN